MELKMMFYLSNVAVVVNMSQPSVRIGGGLHALIPIFFLHVKHRVIGRKVLVLLKSINRLAGFASCRPTQA